MYRKYPYPLRWCSVTEGRYLTLVDEYQDYGMLMDRMPNAAVSIVSPAGEVHVKKHPEPDLVLLAKKP